MARGKVLLAMSGGVDSSVAAAMLLAEGWEVVGCFMRLGSEGESLRAPVCGSGVSSSEPGCGSAIALPQAKIHHRGCCSMDDAEDARRVAAHLGVPFYVLNFKREFGRVIDYFVAEYERGRTPNPCIRCNDWLKFGRLHTFANELGASHIASGHYARIATGESGHPALCRGRDEAKDQSYVLFGVPRSQLGGMLLPIGDLHKAQVREEARRLGLPVAEKPDSQEICFVPSGHYSDLLSARTPLREGALLNVDGQQIGTHPGHQRFTLGQRKGVGHAGGEPLYVVAKDVDANTVTLGRREHLAVAAVDAGGENWLDEPSAEWCPCLAQWRAHGNPVSAQVRSAPTGSGIQVRFEEPQHAVAPGQAIVCYSGARVICGGWIDRASMQLQP